MSLTYEEALAYVKEQYTADRVRPDDITIDTIRQELGIGKEAAAGVMRRMAADPALGWEILKIKSSGRGSLTRVLRRVV